MATMSVSLPDPMEGWVDAQAKTGRHSDASDYVRALIRRDQERVDAPAQLQSLVTEGRDSGVSDRSKATFFKPPANGLPPPGDHLSHDLRG